MKEIPWYIMDFSLPVLSYRELLLSLRPVLVSYFNIKVYVMGTGCEVRFFACT